MKTLTKALAATVTALMVLAPTASADGVIDAHERAYADTNGVDVICVVLEAYPTPDGVIGVAKGVMNDGGFAPDSAVDVVNYAVSTYCPQYWDLLVETGKLYRNGGPLKRAV